VQRQAIDVEAVDVVLPMGPAWWAMWCAGWPGLSGAGTGSLRPLQAPPEAGGLAGPRGTHRHLPCHRVALGGGEQGGQRRRAQGGQPRRRARRSAPARPRCTDGHRRLLPSRLARAHSFFPGLSYELFRGAENEAVKAWEGTDFRPGERSNPASALAFGRVAAQELLDTPAQPGDPPGRGAGCGDSPTTSTPRWSRRPKSSHRREARHEAEPFDPAAPLPQAGWPSKPVRDRQDLHAGGAGHAVRGRARIRRASCSWSPSRGRPPRSCATGSAPV